MCGIVGYVGNNQAAPLLLEGLKRLEYRGYDSAGIAVYENGSFSVTKTKGRLEELVKLTNGGSSIHGTIGIGHTRWATHGQATTENAHPHLSFHKQIVGVHNGIIENYLELKEVLERHGYQFVSQTDTEIAIDLIEYYLDKYKMGIVDALSQAMLRIRGSYALEIMWLNDPETIYVARKDSPIIIGVGQGESFVASDVQAIVEKTNKVYFVDDLEIAAIKKDKIAFFNLNQQPIQKAVQTVSLSPASSDRLGFPNYMLKEIMEQPKVVEDTIRSVMSDGKVDLSRIGIDEKLLTEVKSVCISGCGSAYHAGVVGQYVIEKLARIPVRVELASELRYRESPLMDKTLMILVSQSGETADTLAALRHSKELGLKTLAIVNSETSPMAREADYCFPTLCGPEIAVATTKAFSAQLIAFYSIALAIAKAKGTIKDEEYEQMIADLRALPQQIADFLRRTKSIQRVATRKMNVRDVYFVGRGLDYATCLEGSLKLKELSYIHSDAYPAGELKHGPISLIEENTLVVALFTQTHLAEKTLSNVVEARSRGAKVISIDMVGGDGIRQNTDNLITIGKTNPCFAPSLAVIPLQLMAYYIALAKGLDVDKPRNLAKSVTVE